MRRLPPVCHTNKTSTIMKKQSKELPARAYASATSAKRRQLASLFSVPSSFRMPAKKNNK